MPKFANRIAFKCTEEQWKKSVVYGEPLHDQVAKLGYDLSDLVFYPNKPYVASHYKQDDGRLSTTNTPFKYGRDVCEQWNADLFFALASQLSSVGVQVGEFFTDEKSGKCYRCTKIDGNWLRDDIQVVAFQKHHTHKSTVDDLKVFFNAPVHVSEEKPKDKWKRARPDNHKHEVSNYVESGPVQSVELDLSNMSRTVFGDPDAPITGNSISEVDFPAISFQSQAANEPIRPMSFQEILEHFGEGKDVCVGTIENGHVECKVYSINMVTKTDIGINGEQSIWAPFNQCFRNTSDFLRYALQQVS